MDEQAVKDYLLTGLKLELSSRLTWYGHRKPILVLKLEDNILSEIDGDMIVDLIRNVT
jgi:hypothetical protein